jgi:tetratricopeptide (TPR) repeat protein
MNSTGKTSKVALLGLSSLLATACATGGGVGTKEDKQAAEKSKAYMDGISYVVSGTAGGTCAAPTKVQLNALTANDAPSKEWKDLLSKASACTGDKNWKTLEQVAETMARVDINAPWGAYFLAVSAEARGDYQRALWMTDLALKKAGGQAPLFSYQRGRVLLGLKETSKGMAEIQKAVGLEPKLVHGHMFLAEIYHRDLEWNKAGEHYQAVLAVDDKAPLALAGLGEVRFQQGKHDEAAQLYTKALSWRPQRGDWWLRLAGIYETSLKNNELALTAYRSLRSSVDKGDVKPRPALDLNGKIKSLEEAVAAARQPATAGNPAGGKPQASAAKEQEQVRSKK